MTKSSLCVRKTVPFFFFFFYTLPLYRAKKKKKKRSIHRHRDAFGAYNRFYLLLHCFHLLSISGRNWPPLYSQRKNDFLQYENRIREEFTIRNYTKLSNWLNRLLNTYSGGAFGKINTIDDTILSNYLIFFTRGNCSQSG